MIQCNNSYKKYSIILSWESQSPIPFEIRALFSDFHFETSINLCYLAYATVASYLYILFVVGV